MKGEGPLLENLSLEELISLKPLPKKKRFTKHINAIKDIRKKLNKNKCLIGFCGGPWTVNCYMINGKGIYKFKAAIEAINQEKALLTNYLIN